MQLINKIKQYFYNRQKKRNENLFNRGYDYAAGLLLRKESSPINIQAIISKDKDSFDWGMLAAISDLINLGYVEDDRI